jgi:glyoxylase-like metal-dependent hydrolase (beta-lactamase superfamily II)
LSGVLTASSNWKTFDDRTIDFCQGITLHHLPGHTDGKQTNWREVERN